MHEWAAREAQSGEHETQSGKKEEPLSLNLNLTFMQTPGSGSDPPARVGWYFYKHANQYDWSIWFAIPRGRWEYLLLHFLCVNFCYISTRERICLQNTAVLSLYKCSRFVCILHWLCFWQCLQTNLTSVLKKPFPEIESLNEHQSFTRKDVFTILPTGHRKSIYYNSVDPWCRQIPVPDGYPYPYSAIILVVCFEVSGGLSYLQTAKPWHFSKDVDEHHLLKEAYAFLFRSPEAFLQNVKWRYFLRKIFNKQDLSDRCKWKHSRKHAHWPRPSRSKYTTLHHPSGNISGW